MRHLLVGLLIGVIVAGCDRSEHGHEHEGHDTEPHGHAHDASDALPGQAVTIWTEKTELFMEYRPLTVGQETAFAAHVTAIPSFRAVTEGKLTVEITLADGSTLTGTADQPSNPGIFRPVVRPNKAGECNLRVVVVRDGVTDPISVGPCKVFPDEDTARAELGKETEPASRITYLKEQQWKTDFATTEATEQELRDSVQANGEIQPAAGKDAKLVAPASGRVTFGSPAPILGMTVQENDRIAFFTPHLAGSDRATLEADVQSARAESEVARAQFARAERLFAEQAIPRKSLEEAQARATTASARLKAAAERVQQYAGALATADQPTQGGIALRAPIGGSLVAVEVTSGEAVEAGKLLFRIIDLGHVWLEARIFEPDISKVVGARAGWFVAEGGDRRFAFDDATSELITVGSVIDPMSRTVPVIFSLPNPDGLQRIGQFVKVRIYTGPPVRAAAIPESALIDDAGTQVAYVQVEGEGFERRVVATGIRDAGWVQVIDGVKAGEHVVTTGAYEIKLSAASGIIPAHGHAH